MKKLVKEVLQDMALSMTNLAQVTQGNQGRTEQRQKGDPDSDESSDDADTPPVRKSPKKNPPKAATGAAAHK
jgi:hypothetical protein